MESSKLYQALVASDEAEFLKLVEDDQEDVKVRDSEGRNLLHMAILKLKSVSVFKALLNKVDFSERDDDGNTPVDLMLKDEDFPDDGESVFWEFVREKFLGSKKVDLENLLLKGWLDLWLSDTESDKEVDTEVKEFITCVPDAVIRVQELHNAVRNSDLEKVKSLLEKPDLLKAADRTGLPPLHKAVVLGETDIVEELVKYPDVLALTDHMGRTAIHLAAGRRDGGHLYEILMKAGSDVTTKDLAGRTAEAIYSDPNLLPGEKMFEKITEQLDRPVITRKVKKTDTGQQTVDSKPSSPKPTPPPSAPTAPKEDPRKPVQMYISPDVRRNPPPTTVDGRYVAEHLGSALTQALAEIAEKRPWDPVEYLAHWLYKHQENLNYNKRKSEILAQIREEEAERERELAMREKRREELRELQEKERIRQQEEEEERKRKEQEELQRKAKEEVALSQRPGLETVTEEKEDEAPKEKPHKDADGQTELHKLASQTGADLNTLLSMGYSPAARDSQNRTARDIAQDSNIQENVDAIDNYVRKLVEMQEFDTLQDLLLDGYDKFDVVQERLKQSVTLPDETQEFLNELPDLQERMKAVFKSVQTEGVRELQQSLERKKLIRVKDEYGRSPLHLAVLMSHKEAVEYLATTFPVAIDSKDNMERTPMHYAMAISEDMCTVLEGHGANKQAKDVSQRLPEYYKETPDEIQAMKASLPALSPRPTEGGQETETNPETSQQLSQEPSQQEVTGGQDIVD